MKRKNYKIELNGKHIATKHAWNASLRFIEKHIGEAAKAEGCTYFLTSHGQTKNDDGLHNMGFRLWSNSKRDYMRYQITLED